MKIISKFLTADVRLTQVELRGRTVVMQGLVKEFMPMTVEVEVADLKTLAQLVAVPLKAELRRRLEPLARRLPIAVRERIGAAPPPATP